MITATSVSGGRTSAYVAANYPSDYNVFALVRIEDERCRFPDEKIRKLVEDKIQAPFVGTAEDDTVIYTILDLEQYLGREIDWVTGYTFEWLIRKKMGGHLPNASRRACTTHLKLIPIAQWWLSRFDEPIYMNIGYRANEKSRANTMIEKFVNGCSEIEIAVSMSVDKNGKWHHNKKLVQYQIPQFPLITDGIYSDAIANFWKDKPVRFAPYNNCVHCFNRHPLFLAKMFPLHPNKMQWAADQETKGRWKKDIIYNELKKWKTQNTMDFDDFGPCDSGFCGI